MKKAGALEELELIVSELNRYYENKGNLEEQKRLWEKSIENIEGYNSELNDIDNNILSMTKGCLYSEILLNKILL